MRNTTPRSFPAIALVILVVGYALLLLVVPFSTIIFGAFEDGVTGFLSVFQTPTVQHALLVTFTLSGLATLINAVFGLVTAWVLVRHRFNGKRLFNALVDIPFVFATPIAGFATIIMFGRGGWFAPTIIPIVFAYPAILLVKIFVALPFVTREVQPVLQALPRDTEDAAYVAGASRWTTFRRVLFPEIWTALLYGIVLTFARMVGEFGAVSVVGGALEGYTETATTLIFRTLKDRDPVSSNSVSLLLCVISVVVLIVMTSLKSRLAKEG